VNVAPVPHVGWALRLPPIYPTRVDTPNRILWRPCVKLRFAIAARPTDSRHF